MIFVSILEDLPQKLFFLKFKIWPGRYLHAKFILCEIGVSRRRSKGFGVSPDNRRVRVSPLFFSRVLRLLKRGVIDLSLLTRYCTLLCKPAWDNREVMYVYCVNPARDNRDCTL